MWPIIYEATTPVIGITIAPATASPSAAAFNGDSTLLAAVLAALIAAVVSLVVAALTHVLSRSVEHQQWHRERVFDAVKALEVHWQRLDISKREQREDIRDHPTAEDAQVLLFRPQRAELVKEVQGYLQALIELRVLIRNAELGPIFDRLFTNVETFEYLMRKAGCRKVETQEEAKEFYDVYMVGWRPLPSDHAAVVKHLKDKYLTLPPRWFTVLFGG